MAILFLFELGTYLAPRRVTTMGVDVTRDELLPINLDMTFPGLPCQIISLDALDASGKHEADIGGELHKQRIGSDGRVLGMYESHYEDFELGVISSCGGASGASPCLASSTSRRWRRRARKRRGAASSGA